MDGLQEFTLLRSNAEELVEQEIRNAYLGHSTPIESDAAFDTLMRTAKNDPSLKEYALEDLVGAIDSSQTKVQTDDNISDLRLIKENEKLKKGTLGFISLPIPHRYIIISTF